MEQLCQDKNNPVSIAIVGAGPSGMYCALNILKLFKENNFTNFKLDIFDKSQALRTLLPTGNGRCNITNSISDINEFVSNYPRGKKFLYSVFSRYFTYDALDFFKSIGVETYVQDDGRIFPKADSSAFVKAKMLENLKKYKNTKLIHKEITDISDLDNYDKIIISTGSKGDISLLKSTGHNIIPFKKALCALNIENNIYPKGVSVKSLLGGFVFTDKGISGPLAFKISSLNSRNDFPYEIEIDLFNVNDIKEQIKLNSKKSIGNIVSSFIPRSLSHIIVDDFDKKASEVSTEKIKEYSKLKLKVISASSAGEIVNSGGVDLNELNKNYKSKLKDNLWFTGEVVDIDGFCGGFNLQHCWSSGFIVAFDVVNSIIK